MCRPRPRGKWTSTPGQSWRACANTTSYSVQPQPTCYSSCTCSSGWSSNSTHKASTTTSECSISSPASSSALQAQSSPSSTPISRRKCSCRTLSSGWECHSLISCPALQSILRCIMGRWLMGSGGRYWAGSVYICRRSCRCTGCCRIGICIGIGQGCRGCS